MLGSVPRTGWFRDPTGRHRLRYRDGRWTVYVADGDAVEQDPTGLRKIDKARLRDRIIAGIAVVVGIAVLVLVVTAISSYNQETNHLQDVHERIAQGYVREMDGWHLPASVARSSEPDSVGVNGREDFVWVFRFFVAQPGFTKVQAANDLVTALRAQGYDVSGIDGDWNFNCKSGCAGEILIGSHRIWVWLVH